MATGQKQPFFKRLAFKLRCALARFFHRAGYSKGFYVHRESIAAMFIAPGAKGIEIGAGHHPMNLQPGVEVKYVDNITRDVFIERYEKIQDDPDTVQVDIIDDASRLEKIPDGSQDFVVANHVLEHFRDPVIAVKNMLRVLRSGGILFLSIPDKRFTEDIDRPVTTMEHLLEDYGKDPERSVREHVEEYVREVKKIKDPAEEQAAINLILEESRDIHFHVFSQFEMMDFFSTIRKIPGFDFDIQNFSKNREEAVFVIRKN